MAEAQREHLHERGGRANENERPMSSSPDGRPVLLHIVPTAAADSSDAKAIAQWCNEAGLSVEHCPHVYLGLATILRNRNPSSGSAHAAPVVGVVVHVDDLTAGEFEFFELVERNRRDVPVFVYGPRSADKVVQALHSGARGLATREALAALRSRHPERNDAVKPPDRPSTVIATDIKPVISIDPAQGDAATRLEPPRELSQEVAHPENQVPQSSVSPSKATPAAAAPSAPVSLEDADENSEEPPSVVRVPWLRYNGGPERTAPGQRVKPAAANETPRTEDPPVELFSSPCSMSDVYEPLLTEQELAALLGDEVSDITAAERDMLAGDGEKPGGKAR